MWSKYLFLKTPLSILYCYYPELRLRHGQFLPERKRKMYLQLLDFGKGLWVKLSKLITYKLKCWQGSQNRGQVNYPQLVLLPKTLTLPFFANYVILLNRLFRRRKRKANSQMRPNTFGLYLCMTMLSSVQRFLLNGRSVFLVGTRAKKSERYRDIELERERESEIRQERVSVCVVGLEKKEWDIVCLCVCQREREK